VILASSALTLAPLQRQTGIIPIVFTNIADPVSSGFVASLAHPGGNITGLSPAEFSIYGKLLGILKEAVPNLTRVAVVMNPEQAPQACARLVVMASDRQTEIGKGPGGF
jgi:putative ABC transport system substrate-binding protein